MAANAQRYIQSALANRRPVAQTHALSPVNNSHDIPENLLAKVQSRNRRNKCCHSTKAAVLSDEVEQTEFDHEKWISDSAVSESAREKKRH